MSMGRNVAPKSEEEPEGAVAYKTAVDNGSMGRDIVVGGSHVKSFTDPTKGDRVRFNIEDDEDIYFVRDSTGPRWGLHDPGRIEDAIEGYGEGNARIAKNDSGHMMRLGPDLIGLAVKKKALEAQDKEVTQASNRLTAEYDDMGSGVKEWADEDLSFDRSNTQAKLQSREANRRKIASMMQDSTTRNMQLMDGIAQEVRRVGGKEAWKQQFKEIQAQYRREGRHSDVSDADLNRILSGVENYERARDGKPVAVTSGKGRR